jgi:Bacterial TniB protein
MEGNRRMPATYTLDVFPSDGLVPVLRSLYVEIVRTLGGNIRPTARCHELEHAAISLIGHAKPRMLIINEVQNLLFCRLNNSADCG